MWKRVFFITVLLNYNIVYLTGEGIGQDENDSSNKTITKETVQKLLEFVRDNLDEDFKLPDQSINQNNSDITLVADVKDVYVKGLKQFVIESTNADMSTLTFGATISLKELNVTGSYGLFVDNELIHIEGDGPFGINVTDAVIAFSIVLGIIPSSNLTTASDFLLIPKVNSTQIRFENLAGGGDPCDALNELINIVTPTAIEIATPKLQDFAQNYLNKVLTLLGATLPELIEDIYDLIG